MKISSLNLYHNHISHNSINNVPITNSISFVAKKKYQKQDKPSQTSFLLQIGQKKAPEVEKSVKVLTDKADIINFTEAQILKEDAGQYYKRAVTEIYHPDLQEYDTIQEYMRDIKPIYPSGITVCTKPVRFDARSEEEGLYITLSNHDNKRDNCVRELFFTHYGELVSYKKTSFTEKGETIDSEFHFDEDGNIRHYRASIDMHKKRETSGVEFYFKNGRIKQIEAKSSLDLRKGTKNTEEIIEFQDGVLKSVYLTVRKAKDGTETFKSKYEPDKNGKLICVFNRLI